MPVTQIEFITEPSDTQINSTILPAVRVALKDDAGEIVTTATDEVVIAIENNPGGGVLSGTLTKRAVAGIATFSNLRINQPGVDYTLRATADIAEPAEGLDPRDFCSLWVSGDAPTLAGLLDGAEVGSDPKLIDRITGVRLFEQATEESNAIFRTGGPNGLPYLELGAAGKLFFSNTASTVLSTTGYAIFLVVRPQRAGNPACDWSGSVIYDFAGSNGYGDVSLCLSGGQNKFRLNHYIGGGVTVSVTSSTNYVVGNWHILLALFDGENISISVNRAPLVSAPAATLANSANTPSIGFNDPETDIEEILQFNSYPGADLINQFWEWLSARTAIALV